MSERNYAALTAKWLQTNPGSFQGVDQTALLRLVAEECPVKFLGADEDTRLKNMQDVFNILGYRLRSRTLFDHSGRARGSFWEMPLPGAGVTKLQDMAQPDG